MAEPLPLILDDASLKIAPGPAPAVLVELACLTNHIELTPDVAVTTLDTMCGSRDYPGSVKWSLIATLYQSFDPEATEEVLSAALAGGVPVAFEIVPRKSQPVSATNPRFYGEVIPQPYSPINGDAGDASTVELDWSLSGVYTKSDTAGAASASAFEGMTRTELDAAAIAKGLQPADYPTKAELLTALEAAR
jgi:hypothetical protein